MKKIVVIGSISIDHVFRVDHIVKPKETISSRSMNRFLGGKGLNQAVALSKAYPEVKLVANISDKDQVLLQEITAMGVDASWIDCIEGNTGSTFIQVDQTGQNCIVLDPGVNHHFEKEHLDEMLSRLEEGDLIVLQNEINDLDYLIKAAKFKGLLVAFNPSPYHFKVLDLPLLQVDFLIFNEIEGRALSHFSEPDKILSTLHRRYPNTTLVLTLGELGVMAQQGNTTYELAGLKVNVTDTTGAGDGFTGYFLAALQNGFDVFEALEMANVAGALTVTKVGASSSIPSIQEVGEAMVDYKKSPKKIKQAL